MTGGDLSGVDTLRALAAQVACFEAALLAVSAVHKVSNWDRAASVVRDFARVPPALVRPALCVIVVAESTAAVWLVMPPRSAWGGMLAAAIWMLYLGLILRAILQGRRTADCGCSFGPTARPLGLFQVARNAVLAALAGFCAWPGVGTDGVQASQVLGAAALLALYGALDQVMALRPLRGGEIV